MGIKAWTKRDLYIIITHVRGSGVRGDKALCSSLSQFLRSLDRYQSSTWIENKENLCNDKYIIYRWWNRYHYRIRGYWHAITNDIKVKGRSIGNFRYCYRKKAIMYLNCKDYRRNKVNSNGLCYNVTIVNRSHRSDRNVGYSC